MRAIIDTNVLLAGLLWRGTPHKLLEHVRNGTLTFVSSPALLAEFANVLERQKFDAILIRSGTSREQSLNEVQRLAEIVEPAILPEPICRDPDDNAVLAVALAARADLIVIGDNDLLELAAFESIPIVTPSVAILRIEASK